MTQKEHIEELQDKIKELKAQNQQLRKTQAWYATGLEKLRPLRYHLNELLECPKIQETNTSKAYIITNKKVKEAKSAQKVAEDFFTN